MEPTASRIPVPIQIAIGFSVGLYLGYAATEIKNSKCVFTQKQLELSVKEKEAATGTKAKAPFGACIQVSKWPIN